MSSYNQLNKFLFKSIINFYYIILVDDNNEMEEGIEFKLTYTIFTDSSFLTSKFKDVDNLDRSKNSTKEIEIGK